MTWQNDPESIRGGSRGIPDGGDRRFEAVQFQSPPQLPMRRISNATAPSSASSSSSSSTTTAPPLSPPFLAAKGNGTPSTTMPLSPSSGPPPLSPPHSSAAAATTAAAKMPLLYGGGPASSLSPPRGTPAPYAMSNRLFGLFFLIVVSCAVGLVSVASLVQQASSLALRPHSGGPPTSVLRRGGDGDLKAFAKNNNQNKNSPVALRDPTMPTPAPAPTVKLPVAERWRQLGDLTDYECVGWRQTTNCTPHGDPEPAKFRNCSTPIGDGQSGYCEIRHRQTGATQRVMAMYCDSLRPAVHFQCKDFAEILNYGRQAPAYVHDRAFTYESCQSQFVTDQEHANVSLPVAAEEDPTFFERGVVIVVYEKLLESVYASIRSLRAMGCHLPIELWYIAEETDVRHPILRELTANHGAFLREITDPRASRFYTKIYAVFYSAFDQVLLLDADNFAVRDPTYLFSTPEFTSTGAMFWPDFWRFRKTIFNIQPTSFVWDVFDLDAVDMFEQESGQVLINRRQHLLAMNVMMYYAFHPRIIEEMRLAWGDKDLFRFAWMKTNSPFHMIETPPGSAGQKLPDRNVFCGVTMVQHDPQHEVLFLHRNQEKLTSDNHRVVWQDLQQFKMGEVSLEEYDVRGANGGRYYPQFKRCYGKDIYYEKAFNVRPVSELPWAQLEPQLLGYVQEAGAIVDSAASTTTNSDIATANR